MHLNSLRRAWLLAAYYVPGQVGLGEHIELPGTARPPGATTGFGRGVVVLKAPVPFKGEWAEYTAYEARRCGDHCCASVPACIIRNINGLGAMKSACLSLSRAYFSRKSSRAAAARERGGTVC